MNKKYHHALYRFKNDRTEHSIILDIHPYEWVKVENRRIKKQNDKITKQWEIEKKKIKEALKKWIREAEKMSKWRRGFLSAEEYVWDKHYYSLIDNGPIDKLSYINFIDWKEISEKEYRLGLEAFNYEKNISGE
jgi:hypothetical protein